MLTHLSSRMSLPQNDRVRLERLTKGFSGERKLATLLNEKLTGEHIALYGLQLEVDQNEFQIDCLLIRRDEVYLLEVKNNDGDFYIKDDKWYLIKANKEIRNPTHQLKRCDLMLQQLLQRLNLNFSVVSHLVFVNEEFFLYQAPYNQTLIFPNQLNRFIKKLNHESSPLTVRDQHLARQLSLQHKSFSHHNRPPNYHYQELKKGMACKRCTRLQDKINDNKMIQCPHCNHTEELTDMIIRSLKEFHLLFPNKKITVSAVQEWCNLGLSRKQTFTILKKNMELVGIRKGAHYIFKK